MNKLTVICLGLIVGGCATTDQLCELEKRVARIEGDLYRIDEGAVSNQKARTVSAASKEIGRNVIETRFDAFLREYVGLTFGDDFYKVHPEVPRKDLPWNVNLAGPFIMKKKFRWLSKYYVHICCGKVMKIKLVGKCEGRYSQNSMQEERANMVEELNHLIGTNAKIECNGWSHFTPNLPTMPECSFDGSNTTSFGFAFENKLIGKRLQEEYAARGKSLPPVPRE